MHRIGWNGMRRDTCYVMCPHRHPTYRKVNQDVETANNKLTASMHVNLQSICQPNIVYGQFLDPENCVQRDTEISVITKRNS